MDALQRLQQSLAAATNGITSDDLKRGPQGKWSVGEVVEHLYLTYTRSTQGFERCLAQGKPLSGKPKLKDYFGTLLVIGFGYLPEGRKAPDGTRPSGESAQRFVAEVGARIKEMDDSIVRCEQRFGARTRLIDHPALGPLTGAQWRKFHWIHGRHHIKQILRLKKPLP